MRYKSVVKYPVLILALGIGLSVAVYSYLHQSNSKAMEKKLLFQAYRISKLVTDKLDNYISLLEWQSQLLDDKQKLTDSVTDSDRYFIKNAQHMMRRRPELYAVQWLKPPYTDNLIEPINARNRTLSAEELSSDPIRPWLADKNQHSRYFLNIYDASKSGTKLVAMSRIHPSDENTGTLAAYVDLHAILQKTIFNEIAEGYQLEVTSTDNNHVLYKWYGSKKLSEEYTVTTNIAVHGVELTLSIWPSDKNLSSTETYVAIIISTILLCCFLLSALVIYYLQRSRNSALELKDVNSNLKLEMLEREKIEQQLTDILEYDVLTNLFNRRGFEREMNAWLKFHDPIHDYIAVLLIDLDHFIEVNDTLGHTVGDELIKRIAKEIKNLAPKGSIVAHMGADEFAIGIKQRSNKIDIESIATFARECLDNRFVVAGYELHITASIGVAVCSKTSYNVDKVLRNADIALNHVKQNGRNQYKIYNDGLHTQLTQRIELSKLLRDAISNQELEVFYQPKVNLLTRKIVGVEALLRWIDKDGNYIPPNQFIPIAEDTGLIIPIGEYVLNQAVEQLACWRDIGFPEITMAVNVSGKQLQSDNLLSFITDLKSQYAIPADQLELELTEEVLIDNIKSHTDFMHKARENGLSLAIDDFGVGYSSLSYLKNFPISNLKIDRSFVKDIPENKDDLVIVQAIIGMAQNLGIETVAEGIETDAQCRFLVSRGCKVGQGYLFSPAVSAQELTRILMQFKGNLPTTSTKLDQFE